jgi:diaminopimelate decarboxylase
LLPGSRAQADVSVRDTSPTSLDTASVQPPSVLCARVSAKWIRRRRVGIEIRGSIDLARARTLGVPGGDLVVHVEHLSGADLAAAVEMTVGHIVVSCPWDVAALPCPSHRPLHVLLRTSDASPTAGADHRGFDAAALAQIIADPRMELAGLHADIGSREGAFVSIPAAIGQVIAEMADIRDRHGVALSRVSVGFDTDIETGAVAAAGRAAHIDEALRDACRTFGFPLPSTIVSAAANTSGRSAA